MKNKIFYSGLILGAVIFNFGCSTGKDSNMPDNTTNDSSKADNKTALTGCYRMSIEKDTALLTLELNADLVSGTLAYRPFEKDKSSGVINGIMDKGILKTWFTFQSEGVTSVRQVFFKVINGKLAEAYGDVEMRNDSVYFKYPANLNYEEQHLYTGVDCK